MNIRKLIALLLVLSLCLSLFAACAASDTAEPVTDESTTEPTTESTEPSIFTEPTQSTDPGESTLPTETIPGQLQTGKPVDLSRLWNFLLYGLLALVAVGLIAGQYFLRVYLRFRYCTRNKR